MIRPGLRPTPIPGVVELMSHQFRDHRGAFQNAFRAQEPVFAEAWGDRAIAQVNLSRTEAVGAVRGCICRQRPTAKQSWCAACAAGCGMWR